MTQHDPDEQLRSLLQRCAAADGEALHGLYSLTAPILFACLTRMLRRRSLAEEALQDVFVTVWQRAGQYHPERGRPMAWLMSIARYRAIDLLRHERLAPTLVAEVPENVADEPRHEPQWWVPDSALLERCLGLLSSEQRRCLELAYVRGNSHEDIARLLASPLGTVKSWIRRALRTLRTCLGS